LGIRKLKNQFENEVVGVYFENKGCLGMRINILSLRMKKIIYVSLLTIATSLRVNGYENPLFRDIAFQESANFLISLYEISRNPASYMYSHPDDYVYYKIGSIDKLNKFRRTYDPGRERNYNLFFKASKILDEKSMVAAAAIYIRNDKFHMYRSLEKNFYENYFSIIDTTIGNIKYDGPQLWFLYNRTLLKNLIAGLEINYGVERGLKDVYTKCITIIRNIDAQLGLGYQSNDKNTFIGSHIRYFSRQGKYSAVKEAIDAKVISFFGYHVYRNEIPRSTVRKSDYREGYEIGGQLEKRNILTGGFGMKISGSCGSKSTNVELGSTAVPCPRGYWVREGYRVVGNLNYSPEHSKFGLQFFYENKKYSDWAKSGSYDVVIIENDESSNRFGSTLLIKPLDRIDISAGLDIENIHSKYHEYIVYFNYDKKRSNWTTFGEIQTIINPVLSANFRASLSKIEPFFYWGVDDLKISSIQVGVERIFVFATIGIDFVYEVWEPENADKNIETYGLSISYKK